MSEWKEYRLGDWMQFNPKRTLKKNEVARKITMDLLIPHSKHITSCVYEPYSGGAKFQNGDTIMARITPCLENGKHAFVSSLNNDEIAYGSTEYIVMCGKEGVSDNEYVYYLTHTPFFKYHAIKSMVGSSGRQRAQVDVLENLCMKVPSLAEQRRIASILSTLDSKIECNRKICANLEAQAQALFKHWFIDFAPFKEGKFVESELGMIPEGWRVGKAEDFYTINIGKTPPRAERQWFSESKEENKIWISISDMGTCGAFISDSKEYLTPEAQSKFNVVMVPQGTVLLSFKLTIGRVAIADTELTTNEAIARFILPDNYYKEFTYLYLKQYKYGALGSTSSIATAVNSKIIKSMKMLMPTEDVLVKFSSIIGDIFEDIHILSKESSRLSTLRDTLLPKLMSGQIKV